MRHPFRDRHFGAVLLIFLASPHLESIHAQDMARPVLLHSTTAVERLRARAPEIRITDEKLAGVLELLVSASPTAARAFQAVTRSRLPVAIGRPAVLAALPESAGGLGADERHWLLAAPEPFAHMNEPPVAWVMFRAAHSGRSRLARAPRGHVERAWVVIEVDSIESWNRRAGRPDADLALEQDLLVILAHEFVAHVWSVAARRRAEDLCDDPDPRQRWQSARAAARGKIPPVNGEAASCSLRVENRVRRELNRGLKLQGEQALAQRHNYSLETMRFATAWNQH